jgi:hypothetical protein
MMLSNLVERETVRCSVGKGLNKILNLETLNGLILTHNT